MNYIGQKKYIEREKWDTSALSVCIIIYKKNEDGH